MAVRRVPSCLEGERAVSSDFKKFREVAGEPSRSREPARKVPPPQRAEAEFAEQHSPDLALRKTGIPVMGDMPWGAHLCIFFETKADLLDTAATYFAGRIGKQ